MKLLTRYILSSFGGKVVTREELEEVCGKSVLFGIETSYEPVTYLDFSLAFILGSGKNQVPPRNRYLPFIAVRRLLQSRGLI